MFGVAPQELVIVGLIFLVLFGPSSLPKMAKDIGRFVGEARRAIDDFKEEITAAGEDDEDEDKRSSACPRLRSLVSISAGQHFRNSSRRAADSM
jgi:TatA/E family protein of Tat protein translocase